MQTEPESTSPLQPLNAVVANGPGKSLLAPVWHTIVLVAIMLANSYFTARFMASHRQSQAENLAPRTWDYLLTVGLELLLLLFVWFGLWLKRRKLRELIGGKWSSVEDFLIDVGIAVGFLAVSAAILLGLAYLLGQTSTAQMNDMKQRLAGVLPRTGMELTVWVALSVIAGLVEEIIFRGYLQRQIGALAGNIYVGLIVSALIFGASHGYEGVRNMIRIFVFGALFGLLALWRKSLRPGMLAHAIQDGGAGVAEFIMRKSGMF